jgi:hypothetical protein
MRRLGLLLLALVLATNAAAADALSELRRSFTIAGKPVPPQVFGHFGDAMLSDSRPIVVTVDALAAVRSNRYADPIKRNGPWVQQEKPETRGINGPETMYYKFIGATRDGLLVVVAAWSGGGTGVFHWLHIVDAAWATGFDDSGAAYRRLNLTILRSTALGDRWDGTSKLPATRSASKRPLRAAPSARRLSP